MKVTEVFFATSIWWMDLWSNSFTSGKEISSGLPSSRKMRSYWRESSGGLRGWGGDWSICPVRKAWGSWACSAWRREGCEGTFEMPLNICRVGVRRTGPDSFQWCPVTGQGATGTNWSRGSSSWTGGRTSSLWGWRSPGPGCPEGLWSLLLWRYSSPAWPRCCAACSGWPYLGRVGLGDPQRALPSPAMLGFCDFFGFFFLKCNVQVSAICTSVLVEKGSLSPKHCFCNTRFTHKYWKTVLLGHLSHHTYTHMLPVKLMCGHLCGLHITATTAICKKQSYRGEKWL